MKLLFKADPQTPKPGGVTHFRDVPEVRKGGAGYIKLLFKADPRTPKSAPKTSRGSAGSVKLSQSATLSNC